MEELTPTEVILVSVDISRGYLLDCFLFVLGQDNAKRSNDAGCDLILNREHVFHLAIVSLRPDMGGGLGTDQLRRRTKAISGALDAALEYVACLEVASELGNVNRLALVLEGGIAREHA